MRFEPRELLYLDKEGIESLYSQTTDRDETELTLQNEQGSSGSIEINLIIGKLIALLGGGKKRVEQVKSVLAPEHKLEKLIQGFSLADKSGAFESLDLAANKCTTLNQPVFVCVKEKFNMPQFYAKNGRESVSLSGYVEFEIGKPLDSSQSKVDYYINSDEYFKYGNIRVIMSAGLGKFRRRNEEIGLTVHAERYFRLHEGQMVPLFVFAQLVKIQNQNFFQLKPYAIWW